MFNTTQQKILDAAIECIQELGFEKATINDIAKEAGVTRPTVYNYFSNRYELIRTALLQAGIMFGGKIMAHMEAYEAITDRLVEAIVYAVIHLPQEPYLTVLARPDLSTFINQDALADEDSNKILFAIFQAIFKHEEIDEVDLNEIAELSMRILLSLVMIKGPHEKSEQEHRDFLHRRLAPCLSIRQHAK